MAKYLQFLGAVFVFLVASCSSSSPLKLPTDNERFSQMHLEAGTELLFQEKYHESLASLLEALKYNPKSLDAWNNVGLAYFGLREYQKAADAWNKAIKIEPKYTEAKTNLGALYMEQNKLLLAEMKFKEVLKDLLYTRSFLAHYNLAIIYLRQGKPFLAEEHFALATKTNNSYCQAWFQLGLLAQKRGEYGVATDRFKGATNGTCYNNPEAHYQMARSYLGSGDQRSAKAKLVELIKNFSSTDWARKAENDLSLLQVESK